MQCPACGTPAVTFAVSPDRRLGPIEGAQAAAICPSCLTLTPVDTDSAGVADAGRTDFSAIIEGFPSGEPGVAMALAVGLLVDSVVLHREAVRELFDDASDAGVDPWLVLERLHAAGSVDPDADLGRLRRQLEQLWG